LLENSRPDFPDTADNLANSFVVLCLVRLFGTGRAISEGVSKALKKTAHDAQAQFKYEEEARNVGS
jgi:hypothetical protein